jgi:hypothetical protein
MNYKLNLAYEKTTVMSPGIMVCVTLILKTFEYVHLIIFTFDMCLDLIPFHLYTPGGNDRMPYQVGSHRV